MNIPDGAKPALITVLFDPDDREQPWVVQDNRNATRNEVRCATKVGVLERVATILDNVVLPDCR
jgi:hypothetical protein